MRWCGRRGRQLIYIVEGRGGRRSGRWKVGEGEGKWEEERRNGRGKWKLGEGEGDGKWEREREREGKWEREMESGEKEWEREMESGRGSGRWKVGEGEGVNGSRKECWDGRKRERVLVRVERRAKIVGLEVVGEGDGVSGNGGESSGRRQMGMGEGEEDGVRGRATERGSGEGDLGREGDGEWRRKERG